MRRQATAPLTGHPSLDLAADDWLIVAADARRVERWTLRDRLVKVRPNPGGDSWRLTFAEPREWRKWLSDEDWQWLKTVCDCAALVTEAADAAKNAISADSGAADDPGATQRPARGKGLRKRQRAKAKTRRQQREENYG